MMSSILTNGGSLCTDSLRVMIESPVRARVNWPDGRADAGGGPCDRMGSEAAAMRVTQAMARGHRARPCWFVLGVMGSEPVNNGDLQRARRLLVPHPEVIRVELFVRPIVVVLRVVAGVEQVE